VFNQQPFDIMPVCLHNPISFLKNELENNVSYYRASIADKPD
jgi:hypothetical protein